MDLKTVGTNHHSLPDAQRRLLSSLHHDAEQDLSSMECLPVIHSAPDNLMECCKSTAAAYVTRYRIAVPPHQRLPPELLAEVFYYCLPVDYEDKHYDDYESDTNLGGLVLRIPESVTSEPWTLGHVCSRWREVALHEPRLWNRIVISEDELHHPNAPLEMLQEALMRSGESPLELRFITEIRSDDDNLPLLLSILPHLQRITRLTLYIPTTLVRLFLPLMKEPPRALKALGMRIQPDIYESLLETKFFQDIPRLQELALTGYTDFAPGLVPFLGDAPIPWFQLTILALGPITPLSPITAHQVLRNCSALIECHLDIGPFELGPVTISTFTSPLLSNNIVLPRLQHLQVHIHKWPPTLADVFFAPLVLPSLTFFANMGDGGVSCIALDLLIRRSRCEIVDLYTPMKDAKGAEAMFTGLLNVLVLEVGTVELRASAIKYLMEHQLYARLHKLHCCLGGLRALKAFVDGLERFVTLKELRVSSRNISLDINCIVPTNAKDEFGVQRARCKALTQCPSVPRISVSLSSSPY